MPYQECMLLRLASSPYTEWWTFVCQALHAHVHRWALASFRSNSQLYFIGTEKEDECYGVCFVYILVLLSRTLRLQVPTGVCETV